MKKELNIGLYSNKNEALLGWVKERVNEEGCIFGEFWIDDKVKPQQVYTNKPFKPYGYNIVVTITGEPNKVWFIEELFKRHKKKIDDLEKCLEVSEKKEGEK